MYTKQSDFDLFVEHWGVKPSPGMALEVLDKTDYAVYDCVVTKVEKGQIFVKRDDKSEDELADVICLQTPSDEDDEDDWL